MVNIIESLSPDLGRLGLVALGAFHPGPADCVPGNSATLVLVGNAGPAMWRVFDRDPPDSANPLDRWVEARLGRLAECVGATALFPSGGPPYLPFQRWAQKAGPMRPSPLGILIHAEYGLWHAYRGALIFAERLDLPPPDTRPSPCDTCTQKPCLSACPVDAFSVTEGYAVPACAAHLATPAGVDCTGLGCRARRACPVGGDFIYEPAQAAFHMAAFRRARDG